MMGNSYLFQGFKNQPNILPEANSRLSTILPVNSVSTKGHFCDRIMYQNKAVQTEGVRETDYLLQ